MRHILAALAAVALTLGVGSVAAQSIPTYDANGIRVHSAQTSGCPATSCVEGMLSGSGDGSMCRCTSGGTWVDLASVAVSASSGTDSLSYTINDDAAADTNEDPVLTLAGGDGTALSTVTATLETTSDVFTFALVGGSFAFSQPLAIAGGLTLDGTALTATATEINDALDGIGATVTAANLTTLTDGSDATTLHDHDDTLAQSYTVDSDAIAGDDTDASLVLRSADSGAETSSLFAGSLELIAGPAGSPMLGYTLTDDGTGIDPRLLIGEMAETQDVDAYVVLSGGTGGANEVATLRLDASSDKIILGEATDTISTVAVEQALDVTGDVSVTGTVNGRDVATDGTKLDGIAAGADDIPGEFAGDDLLIGTGAGTMSATVIGAGEFPCRPAAGSLGPCTAAQGRTLLTIDEAQVFHSVSTSHEGASNTVTWAPDPSYDSTNRAAYWRVTGGSDNQSSQRVWVWRVPPDFSDWGATAIRVGHLWSDDTGNNAATLTVLDTAGASVLSKAVAASATYATATAAAVDFSGGTYTEGGLITVRFDLVTDNADTVDVYDLELVYAR